MHTITNNPYAQMPPLFRQRPTYLRIDLDAIAHNFHALRKAAKGSRIMAILKANAYGHGLIPVAMRLAEEKADSFGVAFLEEAVLLRQAGIEAPILVLGGLVGYQTKHFLDYHLDLTASSLLKAQYISEQAQKLRRTARIHLKIDTGMNRIGVRYDNAVKFALDAARLPNLDLVGIFSHFVRAQGPDLTLAHQQLEMFNDVVDGCRKNGLEFEDVHMANSASFFNVNEAFFTITRPGLSLFGYPPGVHLENTLGLKPALSLNSEIVFFKGVRKGTGVGYFHTWHAPEDGWLATLPMGYGDGYPRHLSNVGEVLINGKRYPTVGNISMDQMMVFTGQDQFDVGEQVTMLGRDNSETISAWELATKAGTIAYEILCGWTPRVPRVYEGAGWKPETT
jgi:alanine racemase